ncbi:hypothetical protein HELRODRAFT_179126 [Helobdella robusta]|uniref:Uncharacterized protein n=1 Tax=Helobdella robusta TaxID=6412 RepID=T1FE74_HELRO|nr:hypothetical protein HELRODRAFT_179126 [Helobdella robusta]ESN95656.1 hypothetical protein HELRODRAFT_179126 [Helobdella robusta]
MSLDDSDIDLKLIYNDLKVSMDFSKDHILNYSKCLRFLQLHIVQYLKKHATRSNADRSSTEQNRIDPGGYIIRKNCNTIPISIRAAARRDPATGMFKKPVELLQSDLVCSCLDMRSYRYVGDFNKRVLKIRTAILKMIQTEIGSQ